MEIHREGVTRTVFLIGPWAIKVPSLRTHGLGFSVLLWSFCRGILANQSEAQWSGIDGVCPVRLSLAGLINIYPRCEPVEHYLGDYADIGPSMLPLGDCKPQNLGLLHGRIVWVDYDFS